MAVDSAGRRAARIAKVFVDVTWWLGLVLFPVLVIVVLGAPLLADRGIVSGFASSGFHVEGGRGAPTVELRVSVADDSVAGPAAITSPDTIAASAPRLVRSGHVLEFRTREWGFLYAINALLLAYVAASLVGLHLIRSFLRDVVGADVFTLRNAARLSTLGWLLLGVGILGPQLERLRAWMILRRVELAGARLSADASDADSLWFVGVLVLVIAAAWRYGAELQQDRDLTV